MTRASFIIPIIADSLLEDDETFQLIIVKDNNITRGKIGRTTVTIINNGGSGKYSIN